MTIRFILGFMIGALLGASIALAVAPKSGSDTRNQLLQMVRLNAGGE
jgi:gas vesicle protein